MDVSTFEFLRDRSRWDDGLACFCRIFWCLFKSSGCYCFLFGEELTVTCSIDLFYDAFCLSFEPQFSRGLSGTGSERGRCAAEEVELDAVAARAASSAVSNVPSHLRTARNLQEGKNNGERKESSRQQQGTIDRGNSADKQKVCSSSKDAAPSNMGRGELTGGRLEKGCGRDGELTAGRRWSRTNGASLLELDQKRAAAGQWKERDAGRPLDLDKGGTACGHWKECDAGRPLDLDKGGAAGEHWNVGGD
uniref:Uncharacterized protein n=1 Tax=Oryza brachyantha TaxID=4533 RepID=J3MQX5_ORYBR